ncbi:uncharacterized protein [Lepeophtheirus salmonis]|uniref:uncharacterized protein isoform X1 n=1 Tax=Lepeophtheirus salmonis TaxID=72036 RepID=UPI001AE1A7F5|nr:uncharacterized protein LOC121114864 isoform X1 [Lepeophtheirus salmonis]
MTGLNCVKNGFPASYSLHSVDLLPPSDNPGYISITLTSPPGEIRVVHGNEDLHKTILDVVHSSSYNWKGDTTVLHKGEGWILRFGEGIQEEEDGVDRLIFRSTKGCLLACAILERIITNGWEIVASTELTTTPNFELCTWIIKKCSTPLYNGEVSCLLFDCDNKIKILGTKSQIQINNVVRRAIDKKWPKGLLCDSSDKVPVTLKKEESDSKKSNNDMLEEIDRELKASRDGLDQIDNGEPEHEKTPRPGSKSSFGKKYKTIQDDPDCPSEFELWGSPWRPTKDSERVQSRLLVIELIHSLFCRQWKLVTTCGNLLPSSSHDTLFFCRDGRILPALGGEKGLSALELERPNVIRFYNVNVESKLKSTIIESWSHGLSCKETIIEHESEDVKSLYCNDHPWKQNSCQTWESTSESRLLTQKLIKTMSANNYNLYGSIRMNRHEGSQSSLIIFRQSNISFSESMCLHLSGQNKLCIIGGGADERETVRNAIETRWPYPISQDKNMESQVHLFKVKRYPWANSYGHKDLDKIVKFAASILPPHLSFSSPKNMDSDSGKSLILFALKGLSTLGWRLITSLNSSSDTLLAPYSRATSQYSDPNSFYFMK